MLFRSTEKFRKYKFLRLSLKQEKDSRENKKAKNCDNDCFLLQSVFVFALGGNWRFERTKKMSFFLLLLSSRPIFNQAPYSRPFFIWKDLYFYYFLIRYNNNNNIEDIGRKIRCNKTHEIGKNIFSFVKHFTIYTIYRIKWLVAQSKFCWSCSHLSKL